MAAKQAGFTLSLTLTGFPGLTQANHIIEQVDIGGDKQEVLEVNDLSSDTLWRDYCLGLKEKGEVSIVVYGSPALTLGATGMASISSATGPGAVSLLNTPVLVAETADVSTTKSQLLKTTLKFKMLPTDSRLAGPAAT